MIVIWQKKKKKKRKEKEKKNVKPRLSIEQCKPMFLCEVYSVGYWETLCEPLSRSSELLEPHINYKPT